MNYLTILPEDLAKTIRPINFEFAAKPRYAGTTPTKFFGFWRDSKDQDSPLPWPGDYCDPSMSQEEREKVANLLDSAPRFAMYLGPSWDRLSKDRVDNGNLERSIFPYQWPSGLSHYVRQYGLRIDPQILKDLQL